MGLRGGIRHTTSHCSRVVVWNTPRLKVPHQLDTGRPMLPRETLEIKSWDVVSLEARDPRECNGGIIFITLRKEGDAKI